MPAVADRKPKPAPQDFLTRLENFGKGDVPTALTAYRALVFALADDPKHDADEEHVFEILRALKINRGDLAHDIDTAISLRNDEAQLMSPEQHEQSLARQKEAAEKLKAYLEAIPKLKGTIRYEDGLRVGAAQTRGAIDRVKQSHWRLFGEPDAVRERVEAGKPTGPVLNGQSHHYVPGLVVGTREDVMR